MVKFRGIGSMRSYDIAQEVRTRKVPETVYDTIQETLYRDVPRTEYR